MTPNTWWATRRVVSFAALSVLFLLAAPAQAHRDGCHRWHSCPSDTGSYVCGDLGYTTYCGGTAAPAAAPRAASAPPASGSNARYTMPPDMGGVGSVLPVTRLIDDQNSIS
ncbi:MULTISPECIES: hypothetical protein [unclassified Deinococcus]|uniref:hypothetical protein n=1 Tax=unclassified Deinococcus TaxID=2623546 RepID=UPI001C2F2754|nr:MULTISPECIES: hypothetical protein [unclassified Deinococcus]MDK2013746.1 hypothetical protein [Deinococcus sp. 43]